VDGSWHLSVLGLIHGVVFDVVLGGVSGLWLGGVVGIDQSLTDFSGDLSCPGLLLSSVVNAVRGLIGDVRNLIDVVVSFEVFMSVGSENTIGVIRGIGDGLEARE